jgi:SCP-2 sterol transfer family protein
MTAAALEFLSPAWIAALAATASTASVPRDINLCVQHVIRHAGNTVCYWVRLGDGAAAAGGGCTDDADVTFASDAGTAWELQAGELDAQEAFRAGRLRLRGDVARLVTNRDALAALSDVFAPVRSQTVRTASEMPAGGTFPA